MVGTENEHEITPQEWQFAQEMIRDVQCQLESEHFAQIVGGWDLAVRQFRRLEARSLRAGDTSERSLTFQRLCLTALLLAGRMLLKRAKEEISPQNLAAAGVRAADLEAYIAELQESLEDATRDESPDPVVESLKNRIFSATAGYH